MLAARPYLMGVAGEHAWRCFPLEGLRAVLIGRAPDCAVALTLDDTVSLRHARVERDAADDWRIVDLRSKNGTFVNDREVATADLKRGDRILIGQSSILRFDHLTEAEREGWEGSVKDTVTGCYTRLYFECRLSQLFETAERRGASLSLVMADVDGLKTLNDDDPSHHLAGDCALRAAGAAILASAAAAQDAVACRYGGDEFAVLLPGSERPACAAFAEHLRQAVEQAHAEVAGATFRVTACVGTATAASGLFEKAGQLVAAADANLYRAKARGKNSIVCG
jgi:diguanylate cyclase (GGDEF)-like protein